jgi:hypothetical protein
MAPASVLSTQTVVVTATSIADPAKSASATITLNAPPPPPPAGNATATFVKTDGMTRGTWKGMYGSEGAIIANDSTTNPAYATVNITGATPHLWAATTTDTRAPQKVAATDRIASAWYSTTSFDININITDGKTHRMALYCLDWTAVGRRQNIDVLDATTGALLNRQAVSNFINGTYLTWEIGGRVIVRVTNTGAMNGMISGVFFDANVPPPTAVASASFVQADNITRGSWKGKYGSEGHSIANESSQYPAYAAVTLTGVTPHLWAASTTDTRALLKASATDRIASAWYSTTSMDMRVNLTDGKAHKIAVYCVDYTSFGRKQNVDIIDAATGLLLNRQTVSNFATGTYLVWNVTGNVIIRFTNNGTINAVASGVFFE